MRARRPIAAPVLALVLASCGTGVVQVEKAPTTTDRAVAPPAATTTTAPVVTEPPTTTTIPPPFTAALGEPLVDSLRLGEGGLGRVRFGTDPDDAVAYVRYLLGAPDQDTGWVNADLKGFGVCPGIAARVVRWGWLAIVLSDRSQFAPARRHFAGWRYGPALDEQALYPDGLQLISGVRPGITLGEVRQAYPGGVEILPGNARAASRFRLSSTLGGWLSGGGSGGRVTALLGGETCDP